MGIMENGSYYIIIGYICIGFLAWGLPRFRVWDLGCGIYFRFLGSRFGFVFRVCSLHSLFREHATEPLLNLKRTYQQKKSDLLWLVRVEDFQV